MRFHYLFDINTLLYIYVSIFKENNYYYHNNNN